MTIYIGLGLKQNVLSMSSIYVIYKLCEKTKTEYIKYTPVNYFDLEMSLVDTFDL